MKKNTLTPWIIVVVVVILGWFFLTTCAAESRFDGDWHLEIKPAREVTTVFNQNCDCPRLNPKTWIIIASAAPETQSQHPLLSNFSATTKTGVFYGTQDVETGPLRRPYMRLSFPAQQSIDPHGYTANATYKVRLSSRHLVRGKSETASLAMSAQDLAQYTAVAPRDNAGPVPDYMKERSLHRGPSEAPISFAWRVSEAIHEDFKYGDSGKRDVCEARTGDCGGISMVILRVLRANGIPARLNVGYWVGKPGTHAPEFHARLEFYVKEAGGWIPIDGSGLVTWGNGWSRAFGHDDASFLTVHLGLDMTVDTKYFGVSKFSVLQIPSHWAVGSGDFKMSKVKRTMTVAIDREL